MVSAPDSAVLRDELELLLFDADELPRDTSGMATLNRLAVARAREASGGGVLNDPGFAWFLITHAVQTAPNDPEKAKALTAVTHLLLLGDYGDVALEEALGGRTWKVFLRSAGTTPDGDESPEEFLGRSKSARGALAGIAADFATSRNTFRRGGKYRILVVNTLRDELVALLDSKPAMRRLWAQYEHQGADGSEGRFMPAAAGGWGPPRNTWLHTLRPDHPVLNSRDDHPQLGDSTNFFRAAEINEAGDLLTIPTPHIVVEPGRVYRGMIWVSNDADPKRADAVVTGARVRIKGEGRFTGSARLTAEVRADNTEQAVIWDSIVIALPLPDSSVALRIVPNSALLWSSRDEQDRRSLDTKGLFPGDGVLVGIGGNTDGLLPPERDSITLVTFDFILDKPDFMLTLEARGYRPDEDIQEPYRERAELEPGEVLEMRVRYKNTGTVQQDNVRLELLKLPKAFHYYGNTIEICNSKTDGKWKTFKPDTDSFGYYSLGSYAPGGECLVRFRIKAQKPSLYDYGQGLYWPLTDKLVRIFTENGSKSAGLAMVVFSNTRPLLPHAEERL